jgi:hypothetical protein
VNIRIKIVFTDQGLFLELDVHYSIQIL